MTAPQPAPRPHSWLGEIMSVLAQLLVGIIIIAALRQQSPGCSASSNPNRKDR